MADQKRFVIQITTVGNPDHGQFSWIDDHVTFASDDWASLVEQMTTHQIDFAIGGGNWTNPILFKDGERFATVSYNLRAWKISNGESIPFATVSD